MMDTQISICMVSKGKLIIGEREDPSAERKPTRHNYGSYRNILLSDEDRQASCTLFGTRKMVFIECD